MDLNTHRKLQKQHHCSPARQSSLVGISVKRKEGENTLLLPTPASHLVSKVLELPEAVCLQCLGNDLPLHERCSVLQRGCLPRAAPLHFLVNSSFPGARRLTGAVWTGLTGGQGPGRPRPWLLGLLQGSQGLAQTRAASQGSALAKGQLFPLLFGESIFELSYKAAVMKHNTAEARGQKWDFVGQDWHSQPLGTLGRNSSLSLPPAGQDCLLVVWCLGLRPVPKAGLGVKGHWPPPLTEGSRGRETHWDCTSEQETGNKPLST